MTLTLDNIVYVLVGWLAGGIVLTVLAWRLTRNLAFKTRVVVRSLVLTVAFGFMGMGTDGAAIPLPLLMMMLAGPSRLPEVLFSFVAFWVVVAAIYVGAHAGIRALAKEKKGEQ